ncbi:hypothetical protein Mapa_009847 [Marchantia paleacea]|nr:hypothetical protein Mapa_009847 [Marchantia paleacea]
MTSEEVAMADPRAIVQVNDDQSKEIDDDVLYGDPEGSRNGRTYKKSNWTPAEMVILQAARREDFDRQNKGGLKEKKKTAVERWQWIEDYCWAQGVLKSAQQCQDKWELLASEFKKVNDYEKNIPSGQRSYWEMLGDERKKHRLPRNFYKEVFQALTEWYNKSKAADPGELAVDTSTPAPVLRIACSYGSDAGAGGSPDNTAGSNGEFSDSEGDDAENANGPSTLRKRKLLPKSSDRMAPILERNNKKVVDAMMESEERKDKRHKEDMEMEKVKLKFEKEKFRGTMELGSGYISALNNIGEGLKQLSAALQASRQP